MQTETLIIGAGPAGLAVGACLRRAASPFEIVERRNEVGSAWRAHYERLRLHTDRDHSSLPYFELPKHYPTYPSRKQVVDYLDQYAAHFDLAPRFGQTVLSARREGQRGDWIVETDLSRFRARNLVVATGYTGVPVRPQWPGEERYVGELLHSSDYKTGARFAGKRVLVVGFGNSAGEIAIDLSERGAAPSICVRGPVNVIPKEIYGFPILSLGKRTAAMPAKIADAMVAPLIRALVGDLSQYGLRKLPYGPNEQIRKTGTIPVIDVGTLALLRSGKLQVRPGIRRFHDDGVEFEDGRREAFDAVVLATGYEPRVDRFLHAPEALDDGRPRRSGADSGTPGLYFCGFYVSPTGMLREINHEARAIAKVIAE